MRTAHLYVLLSLLVCEIALAQPRDSVYAIGEITVTATRERAAPRHAPQRVTILDAESIRATASQSVAGLLESRTAFFVRRYGEGLATASLRGAGASQTLLLVDGLRLSDPQLGQFDLSLLPSYLFRSVEVVHGPTAALYGSDGMAGAVNLLRRSADGDHANISSEVGAYGERRMSGSLATEQERVSGLIAAEYGYTDGDFPYLNEALFPSQTVRRRNADRRKRSVFGTMEFDAGAHRIRGAVLYADAEQGLPGGAGTPPVGERRWDEHVRLWLEDDVKLDDSRVGLRGFVHRGTMRYVNPQVAVDQTGRTVTSGAEGVLRYPIGGGRETTGGGREMSHGPPGLLLVAGLSSGFAIAEHPSLAASAWEYRGAAFASASGAVGRIRIYPALRIDTYAQPQQKRRTAISPRMGLNIQPLPSLPIFAKLNAGSAFRMPTFNDRFWQPGGNPELRPEQARTLEAGVYLDVSHTVLEATGFVSRTADQIVWTPGRGDVWTPENLLTTVVKGLEASATFAATPAATAGLLYTYTRAVDRSDPASRSFDRQLRYVPRHQAKAFAQVRRGVLHAAVHGRYIGRRYVTGDESEFLNPAVVMDANAGATRPIGPFRAQLSFVVENVLNVKYALIENYPMPPRHARIRLLLQTRSN